jgi:hypothetical protein
LHRLKLSTILVVEREFEEIERDLVKGRGSLNPPITKPLGRGNTREVCKA